MTATVRITFTDDDEAAHFADMLKTDRGVTYKPHHARPDVDEPQSVKAVSVEHQPEGKR